MRRYGAPGPHGRRRDHREMIDAVAFKFQNGTQGVQLTEKYGNWRGVYNRLRMWAVDGAWERVFIALMARPTRTRTSTGLSRWPPRSCVPTSTRPGPRKKGRRQTNPTTAPSAAPAAD
ncbi:transposase [Streptomyces rishiriensis]|uniref:transposase n=1 Tax=Streptomyces rishiriensis TaxID=68264 RepID=UPI0037B017EF